MSGLISDEQWEQSLRNMREVANLRLRREMRELEYLVWLLIQSAGGEIHVPHALVREFYPGHTYVYREDTDTGTLYRSKVTGVVV